MTPGWFVHLDGKECGPYTSDEMQERAKRGQIGSDTLVSADGSTWVRASQIDFLAMLPLQRTEISGRLTDSTIQSDEAPGKGQSESRPIEPLGMKPPATTAGRWPRIALLFAGVSLVAFIGAFVVFTHYHHKPVDNPTGATPAGEATKKSLSPEELYALVSPGVVTLTLKNENGKRIGSGSGFLVPDELVHDPNSKLSKAIAEVYATKGEPQQLAYLLTNYHVIEGSVDVEITFSDGSKGESVEVVTEDEKADLALLSIVVHSVDPLCRLPLTDRMPRVGTPVCAIGSPRGLANSLSTGIISAIRDDESGASFLQTTAPISPGSSGGPLLSSDGTVLGITTAFLRNGQNLNFAIPISEIREFLDKPSRPRRLWEGRSIQRQIDGEFSLCALRAGMAGIQLTELFKARRQLNERKSKEAIETLLAANASIPSEYRYLYHYLLGRCYYSLAWNESSITAPPQIYQALYRKSPYATSARASFKQAILLNSTFTPAYVLLIEHHLAGGEWTEGLHVADSLLKLMPHCAQAYHLHGRCLVELDRPKAALADLQQSLKLNPADSKVQFQTGTLWLRLNEYEQAIESYNAALSFNYSPPEDCHASIGYAYKQSGKYQQAIDAYEEAKKLGTPARFCDEQIALCRQLLR
jgi:S1-C subfamily serine protease/Flp pilus assembly protein TadD